MEMRWPSCLLRGAVESDKIRPAQEGAVIQATDLKITRLRARVEIATAEISTIEALPLQPRAKAIIAISKLDIECAATCLRCTPDAAEIEQVGQWLDMVEAQLRALRLGLTAIAPCQAPKAKSA
jgi:hypothetical protein